MEPIINIPAAHRKLAARIIKQLYTRAPSTGKVPECSLGLLDLAETAQLVGLVKDGLKILDSVRRDMAKSDPSLFKIIFSRLINGYVRAGSMEKALSLLRLTQKKEYLLRGLYSMAWPLTGTESLDFFGELFLKSGNRVLAKRAFLKAFKLAVAQPQAADFYPHLSLCRGLLECSLRDKALVLLTLLKTEARK